MTVTELKMVAREMREVESGYWVLECWVTLVCKKTGSIVHAMSLDESWNKLGKRRRRVRLKERTKWWRLDGLELPKKNEA